ncbi:hypothetical protein [Dankookia rubra]|nr:hypothetical protein [Dankookia rubra]
MAKGQKRSTREIKKPKASARKPAAAGSVSPFSQPPSPPRKPAREA